MDENSSTFNRRQYLKRTGAITVGILGAAGTASASYNGIAFEDQRGLTVSPQGTLIRNIPGQQGNNGPVYRGIGVNFYSLFSRALENPADPVYRGGLQKLRDHNIQFVRASAGRYWPINWKLYLNNKTEWFNRLDKVVTAAENTGIGLIPCLFWHPVTVSDIVGEPRNQWGNPFSDTIEFMRTYTREIVTRYRDSPAIWGWQFSAEFNLQVDLPNSVTNSQTRGGTHTELGQPATRSPQDDLYTEDLVTATREFAETVRKHDPHRFITTGNSLPRPTQWHQYQYGKFEFDTRAQFAEILKKHNPHPVDTLSIDHYPESAPHVSRPFHEMRFGPNNIVTTEEVYRAAVEVGQNDRRPVILVETGWSRDAPDIPGKTKRETFKRVLSAAFDNGIPFGGVWEYHSNVEARARNWNLTFDNDRAYQLEAIQQANAQRQEKPPNSQ